MTGRNTPAHAGHPNRLRALLHARRDLLAERWYEAIAGTSVTPLSAADVRGRLGALADALIASLCAQPLDQARAEAAGAALADLRYLQPEALGRTLAVLSRLAAELPSDCAAALHARIGPLLGALAAGFTRQLRAIILAEQEHIWGALHREHARVEAVLRDSEARFRAIFDGAAIGIALADMNGRLFLSNPALQAMLGYSDRELQQKLFHELTHPDDLRVELELYHELVAGAREQYQLEKRYLRKDGCLVWGHLTVSLVRGVDGSAQFAIGMVQDMTVQKQVEAALREREALYRLITENANDVIGVLDRTGRYVYASPSFQSVLGYDRSAIALTSFLSYIHPDDRAAAGACLERRAAHETVQATLRYRHAQGAWRWLETSATMTLQSGEQTIVIVCRDITERREIESHLRMAQKLDSVGRLAGGVAHDFSNLLMAIAGFAELAMQALPPGHRALEELAQIGRATERAATLSHQLLAFARKQPIEPRVLALNTLVLDMDSLLRRLLGEHIELRTTPGSELGWVKADPGQLEQVIVNLAINARDAMPEGGTLTIETANVTLDQDQAARHFHCSPGDYVLLAVSDTGAGMSDEVQAHIFEPFFTTKEPGRGTGLGLPSCYGIITQHGGHIRVYSELGRGTTFEVYLPRVREHSAEAGHATPDRAAELPRGSETVLLVEDEDLVRLVVAQQLRELGYTVLEAAHGVEALRVAQDHEQQPIDLLLTDVVMPQLGGKVLAEMLRAERPALRIMCMSGYTRDATADTAQLDSALVLLHKPFNRALLARKVRDVLDEVKAGRIRR